MGSNTLPIDLDKEKLNNLLKKVEANTLTHSEGKELLPLLEKEWKKALNEKDEVLAMEISSLLIAIHAFVSSKETSGSQLYNKISNVY
jgi:hypothetical protein